MRRPYKDLIESYSKGFNSHSLPCSKGIAVATMPVRMPLIGELEKIDMDDYTEEKKADKEKKIKAGKSSFSLAAPSAAPTTAPIRAEKLATAAS